MLRAPRRTNARVTALSPTSRRGMGRRAATRSLASVLLVALMLAACGSSSAANSPQNVVPNAATVESNVQALSGMISYVSNEVGLSAVTSCSAGSDMRHLESEVNASRWGQAAYFVAAVKSDLMEERSQFAGFLSEYPIQRQNFPAQLPWRKMFMSLSRLLAQLPRVTVTVHGNC